MKRTVIIKVTVDPSEYQDGVDTPEGCIDIAVACLWNEADWNSRATISCDGLPDEKGATKVVTLK